MIKFNLDELKSYKTETLLVAFLNLKDDGKTGNLQIVCKYLNCPKYIPSSAEMRNYPDTATKLSRKYELDFLYVQGSQITVDVIGGWSNNHWDALSDIFTELSSRLKSGSEVLSSFEKEFMLALYGLRGTKDDNVYSVDLNYGDEVNDVHWRNIQFIEANCPSVNLSLNPKRGSRKAQIRTETSWIVDNIYKELRAINVYKSDVLLTTQSKK